MQKINGTIATPKGFAADGNHCGLKYKNHDIAWLYSMTPAQAAGVFTTNQVKAASVTYTKEILLAGKLQAVVVNSGNANACTGDEGLKNTKAMAEVTAKKLQIAPDLVAVASTGIIGKPLPMEKVTAGIESLQKQGIADNFAKAILTTDTFTKNVVYQTEIDGHCITMAACGKGSGMIHPNMATMLGFITCDANISSLTLQQLLSELTEVTFNQITVDGDTSTNDMVLLLANGAAGGHEIKTKTLAYQKLKELLKTVMEDLAKMIAKDGEGATKLIEVTTSGACDDLIARMISKSVVGSPLVKTAIFGKDPNWGRILCAIGYSGSPINPEEITITLGDQIVYANGLPTVFDMQKMTAALAEDVIKIFVTLQQGNGQGKAWGCDLTYDYVKINALYHT